MHSLNIPCEVLSDGLRSVVVVPEKQRERAKYEIWQYEQENRQQARPASRITPVIQNGVPGVVVYLIVISIVALLAGDGTFGRNWLSVGRVDGVLIRDGEWWRTVTALTLHGGLTHFAGNAGFGALFGMMAGRVLGSGVTWLTVVIASGVANLINTLLLESTHRAIGASTAVFATLGLVAGFVWRGELMKQDRWPYRIGPIVGGVALLAYTGTGNANTDVGAHLCGFVVGFFAGILMTVVYRYIPSLKVQRASGLLAIFIVIFAWTTALRLWD
ncbi:MAG: rhomboid family intramembrane serine protease [Proteobacteria bacterium]|nr:rhomboid family intramembrane serine protease [Pseudomonadota bacterium]MDA0992672.1 rhomboid family intramembrane serine protease [Pseudomonadota bacterium]